MAALTPPAGKTVWAGPAGAAVGTVSVGIAGFGAHALSDTLGASAQTSLLATAIAVGGPVLVAVLSFAMFLIRRSDRYNRRSQVRDDAEREVMQRLLEEHVAEIRDLRRAVEKKDAENDRLHAKVERLEARLGDGKPHASG